MWVRSPWLCSFGTTERNISRYMTCLNQFIFFLAVSNWVHMPCRRPTTRGAGIWWHTTETMGKPIPFQCWSAERGYITYVHNHKLEYVKLFIKDISINHGLLFRSSGKKRTDLCRYSCRVGTGSRVVHCIGVTIVLAKETRSCVQARLFAVYDVPISDKRKQIGRQKYTLMIDSEHNKMLKIHR